MLFDNLNYSLPQIPGGAGKLEDSVRMLRTSIDDNINGAIYAPKYIGGNNTSIDRFINMRNQAYQMLKSYLPGNYKTYLSAEVYFNTENIHDPNLFKLAIKNTQYVYIELPIGPFNENYNYDLNYLLYKQRLIPIFTNVERYAVLFSREDFKRILQIPYAVYMFNVRSIAKTETLWTIYSLLADGKTVLLGTGAGSPTRTSPNMSEYFNAVKDKYNIEIYRKLVLSNFGFHKNMYIYKHY